MKISLALFLLTLFCAVSSAEPKDPDGEDTHEFLQDTLLITSSKGIGRLQFSADETDWSKLKTIRFKYSNGHGFTRLEGISLTTGGLVAQGQGPTAEGLPVQTLSGEEQAYTIPIFSREEGLEVEIPPDFLKGADFLEIHWVDFYR